MHNSSQKKLTIAIDGYSSCGKSTLARQLADCLSYIYIDSGAMYRAITLYFLNHKIDISDIKEVNDALKNIHIEIDHDNTGTSSTYLNKENVSREIRTMRVSSLVSEVAAIPDIRKFLVEQQRAMNKNDGIVMDGRDIGTVVFPDADIKFFIEADFDVRVDRRYRELQKKSINIKRGEVEENLLHRDYIDSTREVNPLKKAEDAVVVDNTGLNINEQLKLCLNLIQESFPHITFKDCK